MNSAHQSEPKEPQELQPKKHTLCGVRMMSTNKKESPHVEKGPNPPKTYDEVVLERIKKTKAKDGDNLGDSYIDSELLKRLRQRRKLEEKSIL